MTLSLEMAVDRTFTVRAAPDEVWALLADVAASAAFFPDVDRLTPLGDGTWRWELAAVGPPQARFQTVYACRYVGDAKARTMVWTPVDGVGNARVAGTWRVDGRGAGAALVLHTTCRLVLPLPGLLRPVVAPAVDLAFRRSVHTYVDGIVGRFGGPA